MRSLSSSAASTATVGAGLGAFTRCCVYRASVTEQQHAERDYRYGRELRHHGWPTQPACCCESCPPVVASVLLPGSALFGAQPSTLALPITHLRSRA